jgi:hypothetical protein
MQKGKTVMRETSVRSKQDIIACIKEQVAIIQANTEPCTPLKLSVLAHRRAYEPTSEDIKWINANLDISRAIIDACEQFSTWHTSRMRTAIGMPKLAWDLYQRPDKAAFPFELGTPEALEELTHVWMHFEPLMVQRSKSETGRKALNSLLGGIEINL